MMKNNIIFHLPFELKPPTGARYIRPQKLMKAFSKLGYEIDLVEGVGKKRKVDIAKIKEKIIKHQVKYDFLYSESSTFPTLLASGKKDLIRYCLMDFNFFKFCKNNGIKLSVFYRDIHWRFRYIRFVNFWQKMLYHFDLYEYSKLLDVLYMPHLTMYNYNPFKLRGEVKALSPGADMPQTFVIDKKSTDFLNLFYVGGLSNIYDLRKLFIGVNNTSFTKLIFITRKTEWDNEKEKYQPFLNDRITISHAFGENLKNYYNQSSIACLFVNPTPYWKLTYPFKLFEYLGNLKPIIATNGTLAGDFVAENDVGWTIEYSLDSLIELLKYIYNNPKIIEEKINNIQALLPSISWETKAKQIISDLS
ncbi:MAG: glycosyltransferase family 1 protein [Desulfobacterales bacterium]|nr:glycosyltransferase family 1 protein [Desulfobacterales bacterium]